MGTGTGTHYGRKLCTLKKKDGTEWLVTLVQEKSNWPSLTVWYSEKPGDYASMSAYLVASYGPPMHEHSDLWLAFQLWLATGDPVAQRFWDEAIEKAHAEALRDNEWMEYRANVRASREIQAAVDRVRARKGWDK